MENQFETCKIENQEVLEKLKTKIEDFIKVIENHPLDALKTIKDNVMANEMSIYQYITTAMNCWKEGDFLDFGVNVGDVVEMAIFGVEAKLKPTFIKMKIVS